MQTPDFPAQLINMPVACLEQLANYYETMALTLRERAKKQQGFEDIQIRAAERTEFLENSYKTVLEYLSKGYNSPESAIDAAARDLGLPAFAVLGWWKLWQKKSNTAARTERNRVIVDLVKLGVRNKEIARRLGINPNTVTRAINSYLFNGVRPCDRARLFKRRKPSS